jgi:hypothetical protein
MLDIDSHPLVVPPNDTADLYAQPLFGRPGTNQLSGRYNEFDLTPVCRANADEAELQSLFEALPDVLDESVIGPTAADFRFIEMPACPISIIAASPVIRAVYRLP